MSDTILVEFLQKINDLDRQVQELKTVVQGAYYPLAESDYVNLTDTGGFLWDGAGNRAVATYSFDLQDANNNLPDMISAVVLLISGNWAAAAQGSYASVRIRGGAKNSFLVRAMIANISVDHQGVVTLDSNGDIDIVVVGAQLVNATARVVGYFS